jgi:hypothetical protein
MANEIVSDEAKAFFADVNYSIDVWSKHYANMPRSNEISEPDQEHLQVIMSLRRAIEEKKISEKQLEAYFRKAFAGFANSILVSIDGGSSSADHGRIFWLTNEGGESIGEGLHELFEPK